MKRSRTDTPLQALALLNEVTYVEAARKLAERMIVEGGTTSSERIAWAFRRATARRPDAKELSTLAQGLNIPMGIWAAVLLIGSQMTSFAIPEGDMQGQMGLARSNDLKAMLCNGWIIVFFTIVYVVVRTMLTKI